MAERRMFAKSIIESDQFMDMPAEAQMLYIHLNMASDDDGFCDKPRQIMRQCGASNDSMKLLIAKKFVLTFEKNDGFIVVIKHWRMNNYLRKDTYHETKYKEFMREMYLDENNSYSMNPNDGHRPCLKDAEEPRDELVTDSSRTRYESATQVSKGKVSKDKVSVDKVSVEEGIPKGGNEPILLTDRQKAERIEFYRGRIAFFKEQGWETDVWYKLASQEGIAKFELE